MSSTTSEIVSLLRAGNGVVSGEAIAAELGITRAAVSKHIATLREMGFDVLSSTKTGYQLVKVPDVPSQEVLSSLLRTDFVGREIEFHSTITSTNDRAMELGLQGVSEGFVVTADTQTAGRAKNGAPWESPSGKNLYMSVLLTPKTAVDRAFELERIALEALASGVNRLCPDLPMTLMRTGLWSDRSKIGGVLCEVQGEIGRMHHLVAGIGLNVSHHSQRSGNESVFSLTGKLLSRAELTAAVLEELENSYIRWKSHEKTPRSV